MSRTANSNREQDSVLTSLSELRHIEAQRVQEQAERSAQRQAARLEAVEAAHREQQEAARLEAEQQAERARQEVARREAEKREVQLRQQETERLRRVEAELALERARILAAPLEPPRSRPAAAWLMAVILMVGLAAGGTVYLQLQRRSGQLTRYNDELARLDRQARQTQRRLGEQLDLREEQIRRLRQELTSLKQAGEEAALMAAATAKISKVSHGGKAKGKGRGGKNKGKGKGNRKGKGKGKGEETATVPLECLNSADPIGCINRK